MMVIFMMVPVKSGYITKVGAFMLAQPDEADADELEFL